MRIEIASRPEFKFNITRRAVTLLVKLSTRHYDGHCRSISQIGGFLRGWENMLNLAYDDVIALSDSYSVRVYAAWSELDTLLKVMEMCMGLSKEELAIAGTLTMAFDTAMSKSAKLVPTWHDYIEVKGDI